MSTRPDQHIEDTFRPALNSYQLLIWIIVLLITNSMTNSYSWFIQMIGLLPMGFMMYHVYLGWRVYRFEEDCFSSSNWFGKTRIRYEEMEDVYFRNNGMLKQYLFGYPMRSIIIAYGAGTFEVMCDENGVLNELKGKRS